MGKQKKTRQEIKKEKREKRQIKEKINEVELR